MDRNTFLLNDNYKILHDYLCDVLNKIEHNVNTYLATKGLQHLLVKKEVAYGKEEPYNSYIIAFDFFEEARDIEKETQVNFIVILSFDTKNPHPEVLDIAADITSAYRIVSSGWFLKISTLPAEAKTYFENAPDAFVKVLDEFLTNAIAYRAEHAGEEDEEEEE